MEKKLQRFEAYLCEQGYLTEDKVRQAIEKSKAAKLSFKKACLEQLIIKEEDYAMAEAGFMGLSFASLDDYVIDKELLKLVPESLVRKYGMLPLFRIGQTLTLAVHDPNNIIAIDQIKEATRLNIDLVLATESDIQSAVRRYYGFVREMAPDSGAAGPAQAALAGSVAREGAEGDDAPVIRLVNDTIYQASVDRASDIHIEPEEDYVRIRNRVDGVLVEVAKIDKKHLASIVSRIKIMAKLDIAENRKPQDGRIQMKIKTRDVDIRVSVFPTTHGENIVLRLLERHQMEITLKGLGFSTDMESRLRELVTKPYGIILVTGPTGAGKTTTLYAALQTINSPSVNIMTIEDPVEYHIQGVRQTQVNPKASLTFATGLRSALRQDPDVILVGEIRDSETAQIAIESALTGHLVFSTLHTNDAPGAATRLLEMGVEPFLIASSVTAVLAQRLVRVICAHCKEKVKIDRSALKELIEACPEAGSADMLTLYRGKGCSRCHETGYKGRTGIYELMILGEKAREAVLRRASAQELRQIAMKPKDSLRVDGFLKALQGITTLEEVFRVTQG